MKKFFSCFLTLAMFVGASTNAFAFSLPTTTVLADEETGIVYTIKAYDTLSGMREVVLTSDENKDKVVFDYVAGEELTVTEYEYQGSQFFGLIQKYDETKETYDLKNLETLNEELEDDELRRAVAWESGTREWSKTYYYCMGSENTSAYMKAAKYNSNGIVSEKYQIPYSSLSKDNKKICDDYKENILKSAESGKASKISFEIGVGVMVAAAILAVASAPAAIVAALIAAVLGVGTGTGKLVYDTHVCTAKARDLYPQVKILGKAI